MRLFTGFLHILTSSACKGSWVYPSIPVFLQILPSKLESVGVGRQFGKQKMIYSTWEGTARLPLFVPYCFLQAHFTPVWCLRRAGLEKNQSTTIFTPFHQLKRGANAAGNCSDPTNTRLIQINYNTGTLKLSCKDRSWIPHLWKRCVFNEQCCYHKLCWSQN